MNTWRVGGAWLALPTCMAVLACTPWHAKYGIQEEKDLHTQEALPGLVKAVGSDSCGDQYKASVAIHQLAPDDQVTAEALFKALKSDCADDNGYYIAQALGRTGNAGFGFMKQLASQPSGELRYYAVVGLGEMQAPPPEAVALLAEKAASKHELDLAWNASYEAYTSLAKLGPKAADALPTLLGLISDDYYAYYAVTCIGDMGYPSEEAIKALEFLSQNADSGKIRGLAGDKLKALKLKAVSMGGAVKKTEPVRTAEPKPAPVKVVVKKDIVAVFDVEDKSGTFDLKVLDQLTLYMMNQMTQSAGYRVVPREQLKQRLSQQKQDSYKRCYDENCQIELGRSLAAQKTLSTQLLKVGDKCMIVSNMFDLKTETSDKAASQETACNESELLDALKKVAGQYN